jgi:signal transduction histidine kinase/CheY-like chemotaxis protein
MTSPRSGLGLSWKLIASVATLTTVFASATYSLYRLDSSVWQAAGPQEGYSRAVRMLLWIVLSASWAMLIVWLITLARSERKYRRAAEQEAAARRSEKAAITAMQEAVRTRTTFLGMVSHELRSRLQSILSALDVLELRMSGADNAEIVSRVRRSANALEAQLRDLLILAKGEAGRLEIHPEHFDAGELVAGVVSMFVEQANEKGLQIAAHVPSEPVCAIADPTRITQVLTNLVSNAVKYTNTEGGRIDVTLWPFDIERRELVFVVSDTGRGIPAEHLPNLFATYTRFGALERGSQEGAGIGLAVVQTVTEHLGGTVDVQSKEGEGTTFTMRVPAAQLEVGASRESASGSDPRLILIVDDRADVLEALESVARGLGYNCDRAASAAIAANLLAARSYDVVLIDLDMPVKRGEELASETRRAKGPNSDTRLVAISAAENRETGSAWPFNAFLQKPIDRWTLRQAVETRSQG